MKFYWNFQTSHGITHIFIFYHENIWVSPLWAEFFIKITLEGSEISKHELTTTMQHLSSRSLREHPAFLRDFVWISSPGKVPRLLSNWTSCSTACASPRLFLWVLALRPYFPGGRLNALASPPRGSILEIASRHRLGRGLQGYLQYCYKRLATSN